MTVISEKNDMFTEGVLWDEPVLELTTKISKERLVHAVCEFYWTMGHKTISLIRESNDDIDFEDYDPLKSIENAGDFSGISVLVHKENKQELRFDFIIVNIEEDVFKNKVSWDIDTKLKVVHIAFVLFLVVAFVATIIYGYHNIYPNNLFLSRYGTALFAVIIFVPLIQLLYYLFERKIKRIRSHPITIKYKEDFEEFIRRMEKEMRSEMH